ncbi:MAG: plasmid stabilization protein [Thermoleophilia bacterium]|nr:plasmid stabilization protein [Thermoleophilia bacterium]
MATLTIRGLDEALKMRLRLEAASRGYSMEETARQILRQALMSPDVETGGLASRIHAYCLEAEAFDLELPERSAPRPVPCFSDDWA